MKKKKRNPIFMVNNDGVEPLSTKSAPKFSKMTAAEFVKYAADNHIKFTLPEDNRKYPGQKCQEEILNKAFRELHTKLVNEIIDFCKEWHISIDEFRLNADDLEGSIKYGSWQSCTDSCLAFDKYSQEYKDIVSMKKIVSDSEFNKIVANKEPYLLSC